MSVHIFGAIVTPFGTAANNRGETNGKGTTLQKLLWCGSDHTSVSAEAIRYALRERLAEHEPPNRFRDPATGKISWADPDFTTWNNGDAAFIDDDLLGFMRADGAKSEAGEDEGDVSAPTKGRKAKKAPKGTCNNRRGVLEVTRAISLAPYNGDHTFNAASPGATPSAQKKGDNPVPYSTEVHATRYQYGFAMTPRALRRPERAAVAIRALCSLGEVGGNHSRFLYDFSPESVVFRVTEDPAPRLLYCFRETRGVIDAPVLLRRARSGDCPAAELILGGDFADTETARELESLGATRVAGVRKAAELCCERLAGGEVEP
jgi:CRISPR-associated protein Cst2